MKTAQQLEVGKTYEFGPLLKGVSTEQIKGTVVSGTADLAVVEASYMGVDLGEATLEKQKSPGGDTEWVWNWN